jgi:uncharacterized membrane protein YdjX (TVP38/TMEM64 family)
VIRFRAIAGAIAVALLIWQGGRWAGPRMLGVIGDVRQWGLVAPMAFMLLYAVSVVALIPASVLTMAGGAVFGLVRGVAFSFGGALLGSTVAFLLGRYVARRVVERKLATMPRFTAINRAVSAQGLWIVFLLRLSPIVPFNFLNYALGVTRISTKDFAIASAGMLPGAVMYAYAGKVTGEALVLAGQAELTKSASYYAILVAGLAATLAATTLITRTARRALRDV